MKRLLIRDDDGDLFDVLLQPILYHYYKENSKEIRRMVKQQGAGFWIQFITSFRSFVSNSGLDRTGGCENYEEAFIDMLKILTTENSFTEFISLVESLKVLHTLLLSRFGRFLTAANAMTAHIMSGFQKPLHTFPIYSRFVGAVVVLYRRWTHAPRVRARTPPAKWIPPAHWSQQNGHGPRLYDCYLFDHWGNALYRMIGVDKEVMKFFNPQKGGDSTSASSSKNQNNVNVYDTQRRKTRKRRRRNRNRKRNGGVTKPSGMLNGDGSGIERTVAGDGNNAKSGTVEQKEQNRETDAVATSSETAGTDTFRSHDKFSSRKMNVDSGRNNMKAADDQESRMSFGATGEASSTASSTRKGAAMKCDKLFSFKEKGHVSGCTESASGANDKQKERVHPPSKSELPTNTGARVGCTEDDFFLIDSILCGTGKNTDRNTSKLGESSDVNNNVKTKQGKANVPRPEHKEPTSCHTKTADSFRYDKLFTFNRKKNKVHSGGVEVNDERDANATAHNSKKTGPVHHPTDKQFTTNRDTETETKERDFFRYDRLFNFSTGKQNAAADTDGQARTDTTKEKDFFKYDKLFSFSTQKENAPENADNKATTRETKEKDFFRYDKLFNFGTQKQNASENADTKATTNKTEEKDFSSKGKQNATDNADDTSISSDDSYQYDSDTESETLDDDYTAFHNFFGGLFGGPFQRNPRKKKMSQPVRKYLMQKCSYCNILEKYPGMYKACRRCLEEEVKAPKVYCGEHCRRTHWRKQHRNDHKRFGYKYAKFRV